MGKKVLVIGGGGREHALVWKLAQSPLVSVIYCAPGNAGTALAEHCVNLPKLKADDIEGLVAFAKRERPDLTVVGPEVPLCAGIVDAWPEGLAIFGPDKLSAQIEGSKIFAKKMMDDIPTAPWRSFKTVAQAMHYLTYNYINRASVVKADGLAAGKGVIVCANRDEAIDAVRRIMVNHEFGDAGNMIIIEDKLEGIEFSLLAICDGKDFVLLDRVPKDHKPVGEGDIGENTGGMGCYCPAPHLSPELIKDIATRGIAPIVKALNYKGVLYLGGMLMPDNSWAVLEYNCRFGDPETQVILPLLDEDLFELLLAACHGELWDNYDQDLNWHGGACVSVVLCSGGYPGPYEKGKIISGLDEAAAIEGVTIFHAGTDFGKDGEIVTAGGRVLNVTAVAPTFPEARELVYRAIRKISFEGMFCRSDIALNVA